MSHFGAFQTVKSLLGAYQIDLREQVHKSLAIIIPTICVRLEKGDEQLFALIKAIVEESYTAGGRETDKASHAIARDRARSQRHAASCRFRIASASSRATTKSSFGRKSALRLLVPFASAGGRV